MRFSLIMGTVGRQKEVESFFNSMALQTFRDFEIIVVDQNETDPLSSICEKYRDRLEITHLRIDGRGLSRARNYGLQAARGEIIAFPDDDCEYPESLLDTIDGVFRDEDTLDGLTTVLRDKSTGKISCGRFALAEARLSPRNIWRRHISCTIFLRKDICDEIGGFDEEFGVGGRWEGGEESDYLLRALYHGADILYRPDICVFHPDREKTSSPGNSSHAYLRGMGFGALVRKHLALSKSMAQAREAVRRLFRSMAGAALFSVSDRERSRYYIQFIRGAITGFAQYCSGGTLSETDRE